MADAARDLQRINAYRRDLTRRLATTFEHTATVLENSARLADVDAERHEIGGRPDRCAAEHAIARRARDAAKRARANAAHLGDRAERRTPPAG